MNKSNTHIYSILIFLSCGLLGCQQPKALTPAFYSRTDSSLNKNLIETLALKNDWESIQKHLHRINVGRLSSDDRAYVFYWRGVVEYQQGESTLARTHWAAAKRLNPHGDLMSQINMAMSTIRESARMGHGHQKKGGWILQLGIFKNKNSADTLMREMNLKSFKTQIKKTIFRGQPAWLVWMGPFSRQVAKNRQESVNDYGLAAVLKPLTELK